MSKRYFVRAPRPEQYVRDSQGTVIRTELAPHTATQIGFGGKTLKANKNGLFEVTQEEHDLLVGQHGFESAGTVEEGDKPAFMSESESSAKSVGESEPEVPAQPDVKKAARKRAKRGARKPQKPAAEA